MNPERSPSLPRGLAAGDVHPIYARLLRVLLQQLGTDGDAVLSLAGLDPAALMHDDRRLDVETVMRAVAQAVAATGRPWLGLDLGAQAPVSAHGSLGYAAVTAPDAEGALRTLARFGPLRNDAIHWRLEPGGHADGDGLVVCFEERVPLGTARGFVVDATLAAALRVMEAAIGPLPAGVRVDLPLPAPAWSREYERFGAVRVRFGAPRLAIVVDAATLARPCLGADARAHRDACRACEDALAELEGGGRLAPRVAAWLAEAPAGELPAMTETAARCGVSPRTLMRRLKAEGTSYGDLLDDLRRRRAHWLLSRTARPIEDIAAELGYADASNFSRTVRRWFGTTPGALRDKSRGE